MWYLTSPPPRTLRGIDVLEAGEDLGGPGADGVDHDVQPAAVAHGEDDLAGLAAGRGLQHLVEQGEERLDAFDREALGAQVARLQHLLEGVAAHQAVEDPRPVDLAFLVGLQAVLEPLAALGMRDVHELDADRAAVEAAGVLGGLGIGALDQGAVLGTQAVQRVEVGVEIAELAVCVQGLLVETLGIQYGRRGGRGCFHDRPKDIRRKGPFSRRRRALGIRPRKAYGQLAKALVSRTVGNVLPATLV